MNRKVYAFLLETYGQRPMYWLVFALTVVQTLMMRVFSVLAVAHLAAHVSTGNLSAARHDIWFYLVVVLVGLSIRLVKELLALRSENAAYGDLMMRYYEKLVGKDMAFFRDSQAGYLASTFRQHADSAMSLVRQIRGELLQSAVSLTVPALVLLAASWQVGLAVLGVVSVQMVYIFWASARGNPYRVRSQEIYRKISGIVSDDVTNIVTYKTSGSSRVALQRLRELTDEEIETFWQRRKIFAFLDTPREVITVTGMGLAFWIITQAHLGATQSVSLVVLTVTYMVQIFNVISQLPDMITQHDEFITKLYPTLEYLTDQDEKIKDPAQPQAFAAPKGEIALHDVSFSYDPTAPKPAMVLQNFNLHIRAGEQVGIVGLSGAGKSTLASLLMRFDDVTAGSITIDGIDIRAVRQTELRQHIAYVPQEPLLFHRTIRENLLYFSEDVTEAQMIRAAKAAHAHEFIEQLAHGYDTLVGERGIKLSGGQKQRVVIARAILKNAAIMVFDEATSALDSESEKIIQQALPDIIGKRTAIVIAHRLSTVAGLDRIVVMHHGQIIEQGTHAELLKHQGRYYSLWQKQTVQG